jgi:hypothetical protein
LEDGKGVEAGKQLSSTRKGERTMSNTMRASTVFAIGLLVLGGGLESRAQTIDKATDLSKWDSAWELFDPQERLLTEITVKDGKIDFSRTAGQSRTEFLKTLHAAGVRMIYSSILSPLAINSQGQIGPAFESQDQKRFFQAIKAKDGAYNIGAMANAKGHSGRTFNLPSQTGFFQALKERADGFDLANGEGSEIVNASGSVLATVTTEKGAPALKLAAGQSLKTLHDAGLRFFYYKFEPIKGEMKPHAIELIKDDKADVKLEP